MSVFVEGRRSRLNSHKAEAYRLKRVDRAVSDGLNDPNVSDEVVAQRIEVLKDRVRSISGNEHEMHLEHRVVRRVRQAVMRPVGHHFAVELAPVAVSLLQSARSRRPGLVDELVESGALAPVWSSGKGSRQPPAHLQVTGAKAFHGDEARLAVAIWAILAPVADRADSTLPERVRSRATFAAVDRQAADEKRFVWETRHRPWTDLERSHPFVKLGPGDRRTYSERLLYAGSQRVIDPTKFLKETNLGAAAMHLTPLTADLHREYDRKGFRFYPQLKTSVVSLPAYRWTAMLRNERAEVLEHDDYYEWDDRAATLQPKRQPLVRVQKASRSGWDRWTDEVVGNRPGFGKSLLSAYAECPGPWGVAPTPAQEVNLGILHDTLQGFMGHVDRYLDVGEEYLAAVDVIGAAVIGITHRLKDLGVIELTDRELRQHLVPSQGSNGWLLEHDFAPELAGICPI